ncbi:MAG: J domain-containing protein [Isosphaeraceae bacterium]
MSSFTFDIDPQAVLGVPADATLEQIRDAYRRKCKTFHPDAGGEEWAFRVLVQSYELLSTARVLRATRAEPVRGQGPAPAAAPHHQPSDETVRGGFHDQNVPLERMVGVEHLCVRYLWDDAAYLWLTQKQSDEERFLSCSLNLSWPDQGQVATKEATRIVPALNEIFDHMVVSTRVITSRTHSGDDEFAGWLSYSSFDRSWKALRYLHDAVRSRGLGLRQWSRDLFIPKNWGDRPVG